MESVRSAERTLVSSIVAGELLHGFRRGDRYDANRRQFNAFLARPFVELLPVSLTTADRFARVMAALYAKGRPIPTNDVWIAAHAMETGAEPHEPHPRHQNQSTNTWSTSDLRNTKVDPGLP